MKQEGNILIIVLGFLLMLAMASAWMLTNTEDASVNAENRKERKLAFARMETGLAAAKTSIRTNAPDKETSVPVVSYPEKRNASESKVEVMVSPVDQIVPCPAGVSLKSTSSCPAYNIQIEARGHQELTMKDPQDNTATVKIGPKIQVETFYQRLE